MAKLIVGFDLFFFIKTTKYKKNPQIQKKREQGESEFYI